MFLPSASKLDLAYRCTFPWTGRVRWPPRTAFAAADFGTAVSRIAEAAVRDTAADLTDLSFGESDRRRLGIIGGLLLEQLDLDNDVGREPEVAVAYDVAAGTARLLRSTGPRDYSDVRQGELVGTSDLERLTPAGRRVVRDWKTGRYMLGVRPADSGQLRFLGLAAARRHGVDEIDVEIAQVDEDGIRISHDTLDAFTLAGVADELRELWARIGAGGVPCPGHWCADHYCPIVAECPATQAAVIAVAKASEVRFPLSVEIVSPEHAAYTRERLQAVEKAVAGIWAALEQYARTTPVPAGDGRFWGVVERSRESISLEKPEAMAALRAALGEFGFATAVECKTSKAAIHKAAAAQAQKRGEAKKVETALLDELRLLGAVRQSTYTKFEEFAVKEETTP